MKNRLGISSDEFLSQYTYMHVNDKSQHPYAMLKMYDDKEKKCPFVTDDGCSVYTDRPANCRYYPIGQGTLKKEGKAGPEEEEFYFFVKEPHCLGYREDKEWTIESWRADQEVDLYDEMNREWKAIQLRKTMPGRSGLDGKKQAQFYLASYDLDGFKRFILESRFLDVFDLEKETIHKIRNDEVELMKFGFKYINYIMMLKQSLNLKDEALKKNSKETR
jgi:Fe-S-cluster containining protein